MVASPAQIAANRANALRSTGPRSPEGKAASSRNALTHGAHASDDTILAAAPNAYLDPFRARFQPADALEEHLVGHLAVLALRRDRLNAAVEALLELNERHALTECLHERYGVNQRSAYIPGQPAWQAAMRRYDGNTYLDPRHPEPVSDPALDRDPALCSLAYTLSSPRAAALFRHEAAVDRRFHTALKELTTIQAQRRAAAAASPTAAPLHEPRPQHALDRYLRQTTSLPSSLSLDPFAPSAPTPHPTIGTPPPADLSPDSTTSSDSQMPLPDRTRSPLADHETTTHIEQNEPSAPVATADDITPVIDPTSPEQKNEANAPDNLPEHEPSIFLSVLPRHTDQPSSIPALWSDANLTADLCGR